MVRHGKKLFRPVATNNSARLSKDGRDRLKVLARSQLWGWRALPEALDLAP